jgi:hypothetical protein
MNIENKKFISSNNGFVYSVPKTRWKRHLKLMLAYNISLLKKKQLPKPELKEEDVKLIAYNIFDINKLNQDDCMDIIKSELSKLGE